MKKAKGKGLGAYAFIAPHLIIFTLFFAIPAIIGIYISFTKWDLYSNPTFVGLDNYKEILFNKNSIFYQQFYSGLKNTFKFVVLVTPFCIFIPLVMAGTLNGKPRGHKFFQALFYMPGLLSISAVMVIWTFMFNRTFGLVNNVTGSSANWVSTIPYNWIALIVITVWWCIGGNMVIYQAALAGIPKDYYEAASIDGASKLKQFFVITIPSIKNQLIYTLVMTTIAQFNIYGQPLMFNKGGPNGDNRVLMMYIQELAFGTGKSIAGLASAMAVMLGLCIMFIIILQNILLRDDDKKLFNLKKLGNLKKIFGKKDKLKTVGGEECYER